MYISHSSKIPGQPRDELQWEEEEEETLTITEGLDGGGSGIHYSLKFSRLFISLKFWIIH